MTTKNNPTVIADYNEMTLTRDQVDYLEHVGLVYPCCPSDPPLPAECGCGFYHVNCDAAGYFDTFDEEAAVLATLQDTLADAGLK